RAYGVSPVVGVTLVVNTSRVNCGTHGTGRSVRVAVFTQGSPGASTAAPIMLNLLEKVFGDRSLLLRQTMRQGCNKANC
ncbi:malate:quinone oxidoreductase, partial [Escherichia coli]|nr:malate:quinone oxidoreductase [Escherichia coli]